jgi:prepilin signal peptidase PulO-like enzyme (type II secretory pathway)
MPSPRLPRRFKRAAVRLATPNANERERSTEGAIANGYLLIWIALGAALGATLGSFIECARYRLPRGLSLYRPARSYCPSCGASLAAVDNIPIFSWLWLRGRCRRCRASIGAASLIAEILGAVAGALLTYWALR